METFLALYGLYSFLVKLYLAGTATPDVATLRGRIYRLLEWSVVVYGKVKENPDIVRKAAALVDAGRNLRSLEDADRLAGLAEDLHRAVRA